MINLVFVPVCSHSVVWFFGEHHVAFSLRCTAVSHEVYSATVGFVNGAFLSNNKDFGI